jgi:hypothetical protein
VFAVKDAVGADVIEDRERELWQRARRRWAAEENLQILGNLDADRLSIVSFQIRAGDRHLHHNYVAALLNDLFGIQARSGCSCAGPYGHRLLGIDDARSREFQGEILDGWEGIKPGWTRLNLNYFISDTVADYLIEAVALVARYGARLLPEYRFDPRAAGWDHVRHQPPPVRLADLRLTADGTVTAPPTSAARVGEDALPGYLDEARRILTSRPDPSDALSPDLPPAFEKLRWFLLPEGCLADAPHHRA